MAVITETIEEFEFFEGGIGEGEEDFVIEEAAEIGVEVGEEGFDGFGGLGGRDEHRNAVGGLDIAFFVNGVDGVEVFAEEVAEVDGGGPVGVMLETPENPGGFGIGDRFSSC